MGLPGDAHVDGMQDHDNINVTASKGEFKAIRLKVEDAAIEFDRVVVHFGNGTTAPIQIRSKIPQAARRASSISPARSGSSRAWNSGTHGNASNPQKPHVVLWGMH